MIPLKNQLESVTDRQMWAARGASFMAKLKATKAVWFPPQPVEIVSNTAQRNRLSTPRANSPSVDASMSLETITRLPDPGKLDTVLQELKSSSGRRTASKRKRR